MLSLVHLKVLAAVARHGSVTEAAKELSYSQPSVSHHLGRLEAATGAKLIQRAGRGIRLTAEGELLAGRAKEILARVDAASVELAARVGLRAGRVRLAGFQTVLSTLVSKHRIGRPKVVRTNLEGLRVARRLLDRYEELWRERVERMNQLLSDSPKEADRCRDRRPQGPSVAHDDAGGRVRRLAGAGLAALGRSAPARALVGTADVPGDGRCSRPAPRRPRRVPHDRPRG